MGPLWLVPLAFTIPIFFLHGQLQGAFIGYAIGTLIIVGIGQIRAWKGWY